MSEAPESLVEHGAIGPSSRFVEAWNPVLCAWACHLDQLRAARVADQWPFAYAERPSVGHLAAGILRGGEHNAVFEEFAATRRVEGEDRKGRVDLWARVNGATYLIEAKIMWAQDFKYPHRASVHQTARTAFKQARSYRGEAREVDHVGAAVFVVPWTSASDPPSAADVLAWRGREDSLKAWDGVFADYYPTRSRVKKAEDGAYYPGVTLYLLFPQTDA